MCVRCFPHVTNYFDSSRLNFFAVQGMFAECLPYLKGTDIYPRNVPINSFSNTQDSVSASLES